jgi:PIN domain
MCVIIDACLAGEAFGKPPSADMRPVIDWIFKKNGHLVYGGQLATELERLGRARRLLLELLRSGRARLLPNAALAEEGEILRRTNLCRSNDVHVLSLARLSGARTLCTSDRNLQRDFKNQQLIAKPRGKVYTARNHASLLRHTTSCGRLQSRRQGKPKRT